jgi:hypothetical protein
MYILFGNSERRIMVWKESIIAVRVIYSAGNKEAIPTLDVTKHSIRECII